MKWKWIFFSLVSMVLVVLSVMHVAWMKTPNQPRWDRVVVGVNGVPVHDSFPDRAVELINKMSFGKTQSQTAKVVIVDEYEFGKFTKTLVRSDTLWSKVDWSSIENCSCPY